MEAGEPFLCVTLMFDIAISCLFIVSLFLLVSFPIHHARLLRRALGGISHNCQRGDVRRTHLQIFSHLRNGHL